MDAISRFRDNLREEMAAQRLSYRQLAEKAGMGYTFLNRIAKGKASPSIEVCDKIADALGVKIGQLVDDAPEPQKRRRAKAAVA